MAKPTLKERITPGNEILATAALLRGSNLGQLASTEGLGLIESGFAFGINTSALYGIKKNDRPLKAPLSILLRLYGAFPSKITRITTPKFKDLVDLIRKAEPKFKEFSVGPLLGIDKNSIYRIRQVGFENSKDATKILVHTIYWLLKEDIRNWSVIKESVEIEAAARGLDPATIWKKGKWKKQEASPPKEKAPKEKKASTKAPQPKNIVWKS